MQERETGQMLLNVAEQHQVSAVYMQRLLEVAQEHGIDVRTALQSAGITPAALQRRDAVCTVGQRLKILDYVRNTRRIPGLGLLVGVRIMIPDHGIVGYAMLSSARLKDAMNIVARYHQLSNPAVRFSYHIEGDDVVTRKAPILPFDEYAQVYHLEEMLACWIPIGALLQQGTMGFTEIRVPWPKPDYAHLYEQMFKCEIRYNQVDCGARFPRALLDAPIRLASPETALLCEQQCHILADQQDNEGEVVRAVRRVLFSQPGRFPTLEDVAATLNLSSRTLRRRLHGSGTTFREIVENLRMDLARRYLGTTRIPVKSIAFLLGYTEPSNFHRAFKRALGITPETFRRAAVAEAEAGQKAPKKSRKSTEPAG
jgi:AraC-like DNA-binding protein